MSDTAQSVPVVRVGVPAAGPSQDLVAVEAPLGIHLNGEPFALVMRTPGDDRELVAGFLYSEGIVASAGEIATIATPAADTAEVTFTPASRARIAALVAERRNVAVNSSCGVCGRRTVERLLDVPEVGAVDWIVAAEVVADMPGALQRAQTTFADTGGLHGAGLFDAAGALVDVAEDVGRHNAVDKVIGRLLLRERLPFAPGAICVSGRTSYEIVQKAAAAGVPLVAAVSAPSSLAVSLADAVGMTLIGFVRSGRFNIYTHARRIRRSAAGERS